MKDGMLEVGDKLYYTSMSQPHIITITRVTKTQAIAGELRLHRKYNGSTTEIGPKRGWLQTYYGLLTPEIEKEIKHQNQASKIRKVFKERLPLTPEQVEHIYAIVMTEIGPKRGWLQTYYGLLAPEIEKEIKHQNQASKIRKVFKERLPLTPEQVERIYAIVMEGT